MTGKEKVYRGTVRSGRGAGTATMSNPLVLDKYRLVVGLPVIPGTLNVTMAQPFDLTLLRYVNLTEYGFKNDLAAWGIDYTGEMGLTTGRVLVHGKYPAGIIFYNWVPNPTIDAELVSPHHLRTSLGLQDGDTIEFTLEDKGQD